MTGNIVEAVSAAVKVSAAFCHNIYINNTSVLRPFQRGPIQCCIGLNFDFTPQATNEALHFDLNAAIQSLEEVSNGDKQANGASLHQHGGHSFTA